MSTTNDFGKNSEIDLGLIVRRWYRVYGPRIVRDVFKRLRLAHWNFTPPVSPLAKTIAKLHEEQQYIAGKVGAPSNREGIIAAMTDILCRYQRETILKMLQVMDDQAAELKAPEQQGAFRPKEIR